MSLVLPLWRSGAQWIQMAKIHQKFVHSMWLHKNFQTSLSSHTAFPFPEITNLSKRFWHKTHKHANWISPLYFFYYYLISGGIFDNWSNCAACVAALWHAWKSTRFVFAGSLASKLTRTSSMSLAIRLDSMRWLRKIWALRSYKSSRVSPNNSKMIGARFVFLSDYLK